MQADEEVMRALVKAGGGQLFISHHPYNGRLEESYKWLVVFNLKHATDKWGLEIGNMKAFGETKQEALNKAWREYVVRTGIECPSEDNGC